MLRVLDLFSGIGGFSLGLERTGGFRTVAFCEIEPFCLDELRRRWPDVPQYIDVQQLTADQLRRDGIAVDVITGGFPCQDLSGAGKKAGINGERSGLWSHYARLVGELRPRYVIVENVTDLLAGPAESPGLWFGRFLGDLAALGYDAEWHCIPAAAVGAPIVRDRVWIVAKPDEGDGRTWLGFVALWAEAVLRRNLQEGVYARIQAADHAPRDGDGLPERLYCERAGAIGNSVVPQIPELIGHAILEAEARG